MTTPRKRSRSGPSGPNVPESQRHTVRIALRLRPEAAERLREIAEERRETLAEVVSGLVLASS